MSDEELITNDFDTAKRFLIGKSHAGIVHNYATAIELLRDKLGYEYQATSEHCLKHYIQDIMHKETSLLDESSSMKKQDTEKMCRLNNYDFDLYTEYLSAVKY